MRRSRRLAALVLSAAVATGCEDGGSPAADDSPRRPPTTAIERDGVTVLELGTPDGFGEVVVPVGSGAAGVLFVARGSSVDDVVEVVEIVDPDGVSYDARDLVIPAQEGDIAVALPPDASEPIVGDWVVTVESAEGVVGSAVVIDEDVDGRQVVDVEFVLAGDVALEAEPQQLDTLLEAYRRAGETVLEPHDLGVGELTVSERPDLVAEFGDLSLPSGGTDRHQRELCRAVSGGVGVRAVTLVVVDEILDPDVDDAETEGNAAGLPGATLVDDAWTSCVVVAADGSRPIVQLDATVWHEIFHLLGLAHTSEAGGDVFDLLDDTPECDAVEYDTDVDDYVDATECPDGDNLLFHDSDALAITEDQAAVLRRHPVFRRG